MPTIATLTIERKGQTAPWVLDLSGCVGYVGPAVVCPQRGYERDHEAGKAPARRRVVRGVVGNCAVASAMRSGTIVRNYRDLQTHEHALCIARRATRPVDIKVPVISHTKAIATSWP